MKKCKNCGTQLDDSIKICFNCGSSQSVKKSPKKVVKKSKK